MKPEKWQDRIGKNDGSDRLWEDFVRVFGADETVQRGITGGGFEDKRAAYARLAILNDRLRNGPKVIRELQERLVEGMPQVR